MCIRDRLNPNFETNEENRNDGLPHLDLLKIKKKKWSFGMIAGIVSNPFDQNQNTALGTKFGLTTRYQLRNKLALNADLMYFLRNGNYEPITISEHTGYSFGRTLYRFELTPKNTQYLELPIYLTYSMNRHVLEGGVSASYLLGVRGLTNQIKEEGPAIAINDPRWIDETGFRKFTANVMLGYRYKINSKLHFGVRADYAPLGFNISDLEDSSVNFVERAAMGNVKPLHLTFRLTQYF